MNRIKKIDRIVKKDKDEVEQLMNEMWLKEKSGTTIKLFEEFRSHFVNIWLINKEMIKLWDRFEYETSNKDFDDLVDLFKKNTVLPLCMREWSTELLSMTNDLTKIIDKIKE